MILSLRDSNETAQASVFMLVSTTERPGNPRRILKKFLLMIKSMEIAMSDEEN